MSARSRVRTVLLGDDRPGRVASPWPHIWRCFAGLLACLIGVNLIALIVTVRWIDPDIAPALGEWFVLVEGFLLVLLIFFGYVAYQSGDLGTLPPVEAEDAE